MKALYQRASCQTSPGSDSIADRQAAGNLRTSRGIWETSTGMFPGRRNGIGTGCAGPGRTWGSWLDTDNPAWPFPPCGVFFPGKRRNWPLEPKSRDRPARMSAWPSKVRTCIRPGRVCRAPALLSRSGWYRRFQQDICTAYGLIHVFASYPHYTPDRLPSTRLNDKKAPIIYASSHKTGA
jgi:hypothetical protein